MACCMMYRGNLAMAMSAIFFIPSNKPHPPIKQAVIIVIIDFPGFHCLRGLYSAILICSSNYLFLGLHTCFGRFIMVWGIGLLLWEVQDDNRYNSVFFEYPVKLLGSRRRPCTFGMLPARHPSRKLGIWRGFGELSESSYIHITF